MEKALKRWFEWQDNNVPHNLINFEEDFEKIKSKQKSYTLYRGMSVRDFRNKTRTTANELKNLQKNDTVMYNTVKNGSSRTRGLRSWTTNLGTARDFAGKNGVIVKAVVNSANIFLNTANIPWRNDEYTIENEVIVKPSVQKATIVKLPGEYLVLAKRV